MRGRRLKVDWQDDEEELRRSYKAEPDPRVRSRLHALWLLRQGRSTSEVARLIGVHYRTVQDWIRWYRTGGVDEVRRHLLAGRQGRPSRLTKEQEAALVQWAKQQAVQNLADAQWWVEQTFGVRYTYWGMREVFKRLQIRKRLPRR
jgi:transposase